MCVLLPPPSPTYQQASEEQRQVSDSLGGEHKASCATAAGRMCVGWLQRATCRSRPWEQGVACGLAPGRPGTQDLLGSTAGWQCSVCASLLIFIGNYSCSQEDPQLTMSLSGQRVTAVVEPQSLLPSKGTVVTKEEKAGLRSVQGKESRLPLSSQPTAGDTKDPGTSCTKSQKTLHCSQLFPLLLLPPPGSLQNPLSQELWKKSQVPACFPTSNHPPQEEGVKTWGKQVTCG